MESKHKAFLSKGTVLVRTGIGVVMLDSEGKDFHPLPPWSFHPYLGHMIHVQSSWCDQGHESFPLAVLNLIGDNFFMREVVILMVFRCQVWDGNLLRTVHFHTQVAKLPTTTSHQIYLVCKWWSNFGIKDTEALEICVWVYVNGFMAFPHLALSNIPTFIFYRVPRFCTGEKQNRNQSATL